jgi:hypothetical protein
MRFYFNFELRTVIDILFAGIVVVEVTSIVEKPMT